MQNQLLAAATFAVCVTSGAFAGPANVDSVVIDERVFNDYPGTSLTTTNNYPALVRFEETGFPGGSTFANKHTAMFSEDGGATKLDFNYGDGFRASFDMTISSATNPRTEAGFNSDLFGFGFFGALTANGEIAAFGGTLPFASFGPGVYSVGDTVTLIMTYTPGGGEGIAPPSQMRYEYLNQTTATGGAVINTGFGNLEGGIPSAFDQFFGMGVQNVAEFGGSSDVSFTNISIIPAPGTVGVPCAAGFGMTIRRRR